MILQFGQAQTEGESSSVLHVFWVEMATISSSFSVSDLVMTVTAELFR